ncbi:MAG: DUF1186 domain-containing protein [Verrucomicrobiales bacterium]|nr:DUF1186 domain-containing protein [Verrucomicrobiales bacterium]
MTVSAILQQLSTPLPEDANFAPYGRALSAAIEQREAVVPALVRVIEEVALNPVPHLEEPRGHLHVFAIYLLAHFQERQALAPLLRLCSLPDTEPLDLTGSLFYCHGPAVLASVCGGDSAPVMAFVHNEGISGSVRDEAVRALLVQFLWAERSREAVAADFKTLFKTLKRPGDPSVWAALVESTFDLPAPELEAEMLEVLSDTAELEGICSIEVVAGQLHDGNPWRLEGLRATFAPIDALACCGEWLRYQAEEDGLIEPTVEAVDEDGFTVGEDDDEGDLTPEEVKMMFGDDEPEPPEFSPGWAEELSPKPVPYVAPAKVGRNDPCPCGSGKKHKKCCGGV